MRANVGVCAVVLVSTTQSRIKFDHFPYMSHGNDSEIYRPNIHTHISLQ